MRKAVIRNKIRKVLKLATSRMPSLFLGVFLIFSGFKHMLWAGTSFTAEFGLPLIMAVLAGPFLVLSGTGFAVKAVKPRFLNPSYKLPNYPGKEVGEGDFIA